MPPINPHLKVVALFGLMLGLLMLGGCESTPGTPERGAYTTSKSGIQRAEELAAQAAGLASPQRDKLLLEAADIYRDEERFRRLAGALDAIDSDALDGDELLLYRLLAGELALQRQDGEGARQFIALSHPEPDLTAQPNEFQVRWHLTLGEALLSHGEGRQGIAPLVRAAALTGDPDLRARLHDRLWQVLREIPADQFDAGRQEATDGDVAGWYRLATIMRSQSDDITLLVDNIRRWQRENPQHPASRLPPTQLQQLDQLKVLTPARIAVLLPRRGEFAVAAEALTDGLLAAYYQARRQGASVPELRFYDTAADAVDTLYQRAVSDGAELVIGPLQREKLAQLMAMATLPVPVLGLNYVEDQPNHHHNLYQYGLSVRDEAAQLALQGWQLGHRTASAIIPAGRLGETASDAFQAAWRKQGGRLVSTFTYNDTDHDYTERLESFLLIAHSSQRANRLRQLLGRNLDFTPRRRSDLDMILMVSHPERSRQLKPALDFVYAGDLPIFATSQIFSGSPNRALDRDLDGIVFTAMPWALDSAGTDALAPPDDAPVGIRNLFTMGADAYRLHQWLEVLKTLPDSDIMGQTGRLSMVAGNQVQRRLPLARFRNGAPVAAPELSLGGASQP